jgi:hypothetical protein
LAPSKALLHEDTENHTHAVRRLAEPSLSDDFDSVFGTPSSSTQMRREAGSEPLLDGSNGARVSDPL